MKLKRCISFVLVFICMLTLTISAYAIENRASDQINSYSVIVTPTSGTLNVYFSVSGTGLMEKIGCESIEVYEKSGTQWNLVDSMDEDDLGMSRYNAITQKNTIQFDGEAGVEYKVSVIVFAENSAGRDTRTRTLYVTGK